MHSAHTHSTIYTPIYTISYDKYHSYTQYTYIQHTHRHIYKIYCLNDQICTVHIHTVLYIHQYKQYITKKNTHIKNKHRPTYTLYSVSMIKYAQCTYTQYYIYTHIYNILRQVSLIYTIHIYTTHT